MPPLHGASGNWWHQLLPLHLWLPNLSFLLASYPHWWEWTLSCLQKGKYPGTAACLALITRLLHCVWYQRHLFPSRKHSSSHGLDQGWGVASLRFYLHMSRSFCATASLGLFKFRTGLIGEAVDQNQGMLMLGELPKKILSFGVLMHWWSLFGKDSEDFQHQGFAGAKVQLN